MTKCLSKICKVCSQDKSLDDFYRHPNGVNGLMHLCKECHKRRMKINRLTNPDVQERDRIRAKTPKKRAFIRRNSDNWNKANPDGYKAHYTVTNAVRDGRLEKGPCVICGAVERVHAHHRDYSKPLDVQWLCAKCHHRIHAAFPELGANSV